MELAQATYDKDDWSPDDISPMRTCWQEMEEHLVVGLIDASAVSFTYRFGSILGSPGAEYFE